jgi:hypothetical protein
MGRHDRCMDKSEDILDSASFLLNRFQIVYFTGLKNMFAKMLDFDMCRPCCLMMRAAAMTLLLLSGF